MWQLVLLIIIVLLCVNYLSILLLDRLSVQRTNIIEASEGFTDKSSGDKSEDLSKESRTETLVNDEIYDDFYASACNKIFQHDKLVQAEAAIVLHDWTKTTKPEEMRVLDLCSGTGVATCYFAKQGVAKVIGLDRSPAMIRYAKNSITTKTTLNENQLSAIEWKQTDAYGPSALEPSSITHACLFYFTAYHFRDLDAILRNLALWVSPGGHLAIELVNKHKFEPIPDVANPWIAVSPQKYSKERITTAKATFDTFEYETEFDLEDPRAEFRETFRFKDGTSRRQKHVLWMPSMKQVVKKASQAGWNYLKYTDLNIIGFHYGYMLFFVRGE